MDAPRTARCLWKLFEPLHAVTYFAPECIDEYAAAGLKGFWMGYFAGRAAPMGPVEPAVVDATFFSFNPERVARALPDAWSLVAPARVFEARLAGVDRALGRILGPDGVDADIGAMASDMARAAEWARSALEGLTVDGRPLAAANLALSWPEEPHLALWHAATVLREHRGDGHVVALVAAGLDGRQALVTMAATGAVPRAMLQAARSWDDEAWQASTDILIERGWLYEDGAPTASGAVARQEIEDTTDLLAAEPWERLGADDTESLRAVLARFASAIAVTGSVPVPNPVGLPLPD
jgi:hypothetical protein